MTPKKTRILFVAEAVTLAHIGRLARLARSLDQARFEICLASDPRYDHLLGMLPFSRRRIETISGERFFAALKKGAPIYDLATLQRYVEADLALIDEFRPDLVVGDFRLSLDVSTKLRSVPYLTVTNAYWSPFATIKYPVPEIPLTRMVGVPLAQGFFDLARPLVFAIHAVPLNRLRRKFGLPSLPWDLRHSYTNADHVVYADIPELVPTRNLPPNHHFIGPILWSPEVPLPPWWDALPDDRPLIYATLGSSGQSDLLPIVLEALSRLSVSVIAATGGRVATERIHPNTFIEDFVPGEQAAARASLVICNGGSPTSYQALANGVPVIGIASNLDQYLNMSLIEESGAGTLIRAGQASATRIQRSTERILGTPAIRKNAEQLKLAISRYQAPRNFSALLETIRPV
jgi:UDP:flavonoid glycosyltransferase YjiC (YdhE family)